MKEWIRRHWLKLVKYLFGLLIAGFICWGFVSFSKDDNWLAVSALATLVLAVAAFISVRQVNVNQKRERKERLLNEIIEWALAILNIGRVKELPTDVFTRQSFMEGKKVEIENDLRKEIIKDEMLENL